MTCNSLPAEAIITNGLFHEKDTKASKLNHSVVNGLVDETQTEGVNTLTNGSVTRRDICNGNLHCPQPALVQSDADPSSSTSNNVSVGTGQLTFIETGINTLLGDAGENGDAVIDTFIESFHDKVDKDSLTKEALKLLSLIPDGYIPLPHQVGGHRHVEGNFGMLHSTASVETLYKPVLGTKGPREVLFYKYMFESLTTDDVPKEIITLQELVPKYYGTRDIMDKSGETHQYMILEDIVSRFEKPCVMDIKIGSRRRLGNSAAEAIAPHKRSTFQEINFFRIIGMRVYRSTTDNYDFYDSQYGRKISVDGGRDALELFFKDGEIKRTHMIGPIIERLYKFLHWFEKQTYFKIYSSSVIIVYEGSTNSHVMKSARDLLDIRLVDFGRTYDCSRVEWCDYDKDTFIGLRNLIKFLEELGHS